MSRETGLEIAIGVFLAAQSQFGAGQRAEGLPVGPVRGDVTFQPADRGLRGSV